MKKMAYLKSDLTRVFTSVQFWIGCMGVSFAMFLSIYRMTNVVSVYGAYRDAIYFIPFILSMTFCAIPFAGSLSEDLEYRYIYMLLLKGNLKEYTISKVLTISLSSILAMVGGILGFVILIRFRVPWITESDILSQDILMSAFIKPKLYFLYFIVHAVYMGGLAALLSVLSAYVSLFWSNKLLLLSVPFMSYYLLVFYSGELFSGLPQMNISYMFNPSYNVWDSNVLSLICPFIVSGGAISVLGVCIYKKLRRLCNE